MTNSVFVPGEPPVFDVKKSERLREWMQKIESAYARQASHPRLRFVVGAWQRWYNYFDLDNLCKPVLEVIAKDAESLWATMELGDQPGVYISDFMPPTPPHVDGTFYIVHAPMTSKKQDEALPELVDANRIGTDEPLGVLLRFDSGKLSVGYKSIDFGPVKAALDALTQLVGMHKKQVADHRIHELRVLKGARPESDGVTIDVWRL